MIALVRFFFELSCKQWKCYTHIQTCWHTYGTGRCFISPFLTSTGGGIIIWWDKTDAKNISITVPEKLNVPEACVTDHSVTNCIKIMFLAAVDSEKFLQFLWWIAWTFFPQVWKCLQHCSHKSLWLLTTCGIYKINYTQLFVQVGQLTRPQYSSLSSSWGR